MILQKKQIAKCIVRIAKIAVLVFCSQALSDGVIYGTMNDGASMNHFKYLKHIWILMTVLIMLAVSRMIVRIVDAAVQIDDDIGILLFLLFIVNALIAALSHRIYLRTKNQS